MIKYVYNDLFPSDSALFYTTQLFVDQNIKRYLRYSGESYLRKLISILQL